MNCLWVRLASPFRSCQIRYSLALFTGLFLSGCEKLPVFEYEIYPENDIAITGVLIGLEGSGLSLSLNGGFAQELVDNGRFTLDKKLRAGSEYNLAITNQPRYPEQVCSITGATGLAYGPVGDVEITCETREYMVKGSVKGLAGSGLEVSLNGGSGLEINSDGEFSFESSVSDGGQYNVQVTNNPGSPNQTCTASSNTGRVTGANVVDVRVICSTEQYTVGGFVNGLSEGSLTLSLNGGDDLEVSADGFFTFPAAVADTSPYRLTVKELNSGTEQTCSVSNGIGIITGRSVGQAVVQCSPQDYSLGGTVTGLDDNSVSLVSSDGEILEIRENGEFQFENPFADSSSYRVEIFRQPKAPPRVCALTNGRGEIKGAAKADLILTCRENGLDVGGTIAGLTGEGLVLRLNGTTDQLLLPEAGEFSFPDHLVESGEYEVTVAGQPAGQFCEVNGGSGTSGVEDVNNIEITCVDAYDVGGTISGLNGSNLVLENSTGEFIPVSANGSFTLPRALTDGEAYSITVANHPESVYQFCSVANASGTVSGSDIGNINIACTDILVDFALTETTVDEDVAPYTFQVLLALSQPAPRDVAIDLGVTGGLASAGSDFTLDTPSVTISAGNTVGIALLTVYDDFLIESDETVRLTIGDTSGASPGNTLNHTQTISSGECIVVDALDDSTGSNGSVSLREALQAADTDSVVGDAPAGSGGDCLDLTGLSGTIIINSHMMAVSSDIRIYGPGSDDLAIDGQNQWRPLRIAGGNFSLSGLEIRNGLAAGENGNSPNDSRRSGGGGGLGMGGAIFIEDGMVTIDDVVFIGNEAMGGDGGNRTQAAVFSETGKSGGGPAGGPTINGAGGFDTADGQDGGFGTGGGGGGTDNSNPGDGGNGGYGAGGGGGGSSAGGGNSGSRGLGGEFGGRGGQWCCASAGGGGGGAGLGGAIGLYRGSLIITNARFENNSTAGGTEGSQGAGDPGQAKGGAIFFDTNAGSVFAWDLEFSGNSAPDQTGAADDNHDIYGFTYP